jgi:hypothetical protein
MDSFHLLFTARGYFQPQEGRLFLFHSRDFCYGFQAVGIQYFYTNTILLGDICGAKNS